MVKYVNFPGILTQLIESNEGSSVFQERPPPLTVLFSVFSRRTNQVLIHELCLHGNLIFPERAVLWMTLPKGEDRVATEERRNGPNQSKMFLSSLSCDFFRAIATGVALETRELEAASSLPCLSRFNYRSQDERNDYNDDNHLLGKMCPCRAQPMDRLQSPRQLCEAHSDVTLTDKEPDR